jgi:hypothetical protein
MGIAGKTEGMNGKLAPALWAEGKRDEVLRHVAQDVRTALDLATACESCGVFRWVARRRALNRVRPRVRYVCNAALPALQTAHKRTWRVPRLV